jgi:hypothetical protein
MASFTPRFANLPRESVRATAWLLFAMAGFVSIATGCKNSAEESLFAIEEVSASRRAGGLTIHIRQQISLSGEAREALLNGVPLSVEILAELRGSDGDPLISKTRQVRQIRYLPMSDHYELSKGTVVQTYPRLRHLLAALGNTQFALEAGGLAAGAYQLRARSLLDKQSLPPPMRLPAFLSTGWDHDSGWATTPLELVDSR